MEQLSVAQAARRLGVKPPTLYAYVSRGVLHSTRAPDGRRSLFDADEVEQLARRGRPRRTSRVAALDIVIETSITEIDHRGVRLRGHPLDRLAVSSSFEDVAMLLWTGRLEPTEPWPAVTARAKTDDPGRVLDRFMTAVVAAAAADAERSRRDVDALPRVGPRLATAMLESLPMVGDVRTPRLHLPDRAPLRGSMAGQLWTRLSPSRPPSGAVRTINAALVLLADHELAASTLAVRVAACTRADPYAAVLAGLAAVSGPLHGSASRQTRRVIRRAEASSADTAVLEAREALGFLPGFGHALYPHGDPRATVLLRLAREAWPGSRRWLHVDATIAAARRRADVAPNIDLALAAIGHVAGMDDEAGERIFAIARTAGWLAHAFEEYGEAPLRFRPRAQFRG